MTLDKSSNLAGPQFGPNEEIVNSITLQGCLEDQIGEQITWKCRQYCGNEDDEASQARRPICGPITRGFFARLSYGDVTTLDMHTQRLVQKAETL